MSVEAAAPDSPHADAGASGPDLNCLQIGEAWLPEQSGGLNRLYYDLLHHLPAAGVRCRGLVVGTASGWPADPAVRVEAFARPDVSLGRRWMGERRAVAAAVDAESPDLIVTHFAPYAFPVLGWATSARPMVVHFQGPWAEESRREGGGRLACAAKAMLERRVYRRARRLIVLSPPFKQILVDDYGVPADRIHVVPGGVDCGRFDTSLSRTDARVKLGWPTDRPVVLAVRRLARRMGLENLIEAAEAVRRAVPDALVLIAGGGGERERLAAQIADRGLGETVRLLGFVPDDDLPAAYRAADLTVVPTVALEGFGLVAAESLSAGTPVLATPVDGLVDLVGQLSPPLLFAGSTAADIAAGLTAALTGRLPLPPAAECAGYARRRFDWPVIAAAVAAVYREAVAGGPRRT